MATVLRPEEHDARPASCGRPVLNVETRVVDPDMNDVPPGTHGEIVHRSPHLMVGYWDKPEETAEAFAGGWFHSGDVGYFDDEGYLYIVDRIRDVINTGGVLVASREVEEVLFTHPGRIGSRGGRAAGRQMDRGGDGVRGAAPGPDG